MKGEVLKGKLVGPVPLVYRAGDIVLTRSPSWLGKAIRVLTREPGESKTIYNHVGLIVNDAYSVDHAVIVEALGRGVKQRVFAKAYPKDGPIRVAVYRHQDAGLGNRAASFIVHQVGQRYGYLKLLFHAADRVVFAGKLRVFRRLGMVARWPICSMLVAGAYREAGYSFGRPASVQPDDIADIVEASDQWSRVG